MAPVKILFIGNNHTYYNHILRMLEKLSAFGSPNNPILTKKMLVPVHALGGTGAIRTPGRPYRKAYTEIGH